MGQQVIDFVESMVKRRRSRFDYIVNNIHDEIVIEVSPYRTGNIHMWFHDGKKEPVKLSGRRGQNCSDGFPLWYVEPLLSEETNYPLVSERHLSRHTLCAMEVIAWATAAE